MIWAGSRSSYISTEKRTPSEYQSLWVPKDALFTKYPVGTPREEGSAWYLRGYPYGVQSRENDAVKMRQPISSQESCICGSEELVNPSQFPEKRLESSNEREVGASLETKLVPLALFSRLWWKRQRFGKDPKWRRLLQKCLLVVARIGPALQWFRPQLKGQYRRPPEVQEFFGGRPKRNKAKIRNCHNEVVTGKQLTSLNSCGGRASLTVFTSNFSFGSSSDFHNISMKSWWAAGSPPQFNPSVPARIHSVSRAITSIR